MKEMLKKFFHEVFRFSVYIKAVYGVFEIIFGSILLFISTNAISNFIKSMFNKEIIEDQHDLIVNNAIASTNYITINTKFFIALYLLINGTVKVILVYSLLKEKKWAYPVAGVLISLLLCYELYRIIVSFSWIILFLVFVDITILTLLRFEYLNFIKKKRKD